MTTPSSSCSCISRSTSGNHFHLDLPLRPGQCGDHHGARRRVDWKIPHEKLRLNPETRAASVMKTVHLSTSERPAPRLWDLGRILRDRPRLVANVLRRDAIRALTGNWRSKTATRLPRSPGRSEPDRKARSLWHNSLHFMPFLKASTAATACASLWRPVDRSAQRRAPPPPDNPDVLHETLERGGMRDPVRSSLLTSTRAARSGQRRGSKLPLAAAL